MFGGEGDGAILTLDSGIPKLLDSPSAYGEFKRLCDEVFLSIDEVDIHEHVYGQAGRD